MGSGVYFPDQKGLTLLYETAIPAAAEIVIDSADLDLTQYSFVKLIGFEIAHAGGGAQSSVFSLSASEDDGVSWDQQWTYASILGGAYLGFLYDLDLRGGNGHGFASVGAAGAAKNGFINLTAGDRIDAIKLAHSVYNFTGGNLEIWA